MSKAFIFDVFGTCVDWRSSIAREVAATLVNVDALAFADAWRAEYQPAMERIRKGGRGYVDLDDLHLENLMRTADAFKVAVPDPALLSRAWEKLDPWPDVPAGLRAIAKSGIVAPCSNGSIALMTQLARYADLQWDCILGAGIARDYKPKPGVYLASVSALRMQPEEVCMVAAHNDDLVAARAAGLMTAFVPRAREHGNGQKTDLAPEEAWDWVASDFLDLARQVAA